ncbi:TPA: ash family protein [Klebsiella pneumoniae]|nr:ash family protein [Klebsiella pneumoniae]
MMMLVPQKAPFSGLLPFVVSRYSFLAVAKSTAGICSPCNSMATPDAPCVFFLRRSSDTPIFRAVVFTPWLLSDNGGSGGAAFGLAGIH